MIRYLRNRLPLRIIAVWLAAVLCVYLFVLEAPRFVAKDGSSELVHLPASSGSAGDTVVQAIVFIAMGDMARDGLVEYALTSLRRVGRWKGPLFLLTDAPACFAETSDDIKLTVVTIPHKSSLMEIKALKPQMFDHLPADIDSVLYLDVDIVVMRDLSYFLDMMGRDLALPRRPSPAPPAPQAVSTPEPTRVASAGAFSRSFDLAAFGDARGHYVGFCAGCEKWHTGVLLLSRHGGSSAPGGKNKCLDAWAEVLASGRFDTDQESLDAAERTGSCRHAHMLPSRFLLFAKDYIAALLTTGHTFVHVTSAARLSQQDSFYRNWVVPRIRDALASRVSPGILDQRKQCT